MLFVIYEACVTWFFIFNSRFLDSPVNEPFPSTNSCRRAVRRVYAIRNEVYGEFTGLSRILFYHVSHPLVENIKILFNFVNYKTFLLNLIRRQTFVTSYYSSCRSVYWNCILLQLYCVKFLFYGCNELSGKSDSVTAS